MLLLLRPAALRIRRGRMRRPPARAMHAGPACRSASAATRPAAHTPTAPCSSASAARLALSMPRHRRRPCSTRRGVSRSLLLLPLLLPLLSRLRSRARAKAHSELRVPSRYRAPPLPNLAQARPLRAPPSPSPTAPRSPPTRSGNRVSSPGSRFAPDTPGSRPYANAPDPPSYTAAHPPRTDRR
ncbi:hypothetical protein Y037_6189 [Burkholderia pseudomallei MSHR983]|nr:hypothetical protein Y037_6189 [Burkholderia pseudomallei MSHR983]